MNNSVKSQCLKIIWSAINAAKPGQGEIVLYCRNEDAATMVNCLNIPQVRNAMEAKGLTFTIKATSSEDFQLREQANVTYYALLVACALLSEKTEITSNKWMSLLMTHGLNQVQNNAGEVAKTVAKTVPVKILPNDELGEIIAQKIDENKVQYNLLKIAKGGKSNLTVEQLEVIYNKLAALDAEVNINCDLSSASLIICCLESVLNKLDDISDPWCKGIKQLCNEMKSNITKLVPESMELFIDVELSK